MIVPDASVVLDALTDDGPRGEAARAAMASDLDWAAPAHLFIEVVSALRRRVGRGEVAPDRAAQAVSSLGELVVDWPDPGSLLTRVWDLRSNVTPFDAAYVATAEAFGCELVTSDRRLAGAPGPRCDIRVV